MTETPHIATKANAALKYIGFIPLIILIHDTAILLLGIYSFGRLPVYGKDPDPSSLNISYDTFFGTVGVLAIMPSVIIITSTAIIALHIAICKIKISRAELHAMLIPFLVLGWHLLFRFCLPQSFAWVMD